MSRWFAPHSGVHVVAVPLPHTEGGSAAGIYSPENSTGQNPSVWVSEAHLKGAFSNFQGFSYWVVYCTLFLLLYIQKSKF